MAVKYLEVANNLRTQIIQGIYEHKLPTETEMTLLFNVSKITIKRALNILETEGLIYKVQGSGIYVNTSQNVILTSNYETQMRGFKKSHPKQNFETIVHKFRIIECPESIAPYLDINPGSEVYEIYRIRKRNQQAERYEQTYIPVELIPNLSKEICENSIYDYITEELNFKILRTNDYFFATQANELDKFILDTQDNEVVINLEQIAFLNGNKKFQYSLTKYKYQFFDFKTITNFNDSHKE